MKKLVPFLIVAFFAACTPELDAPEPDPGRADFSKSIAVGGNFLSGYQDGALFRKGQVNSIPNLLAAQFKLAGGGGFNQALMPDDHGLGLNFKVWESWFNKRSRLSYKTDCLGVTALSPLKDSLPVAGASDYLAGIAGNSIQNLAVPFATTADYFTTSFGAAFNYSAQHNPYYNRIASNPGASTLYADVINQNATFVTAWLGMEDVYNFAASGGTSGSLPSAAVFSARLDSLLSGLTSNGAKGVIANIPDFRVFPYYTLVAWDNANLTRQSQADSLNYLYDTLSGLTHIHFVVGRNGFVIDDPAANGGLRQLHAGEYITLSVPVDSMKCYKYGILLSTVHDRYVLDSDEVAAIDNAISSYNAVIVQKAMQYDFAFADMNAYFHSLQAGIMWDGATMNTTFVSGGFFSLDGYHPNQKGYALIANEFIRAINNKYESVIPTINCVDCDGILFP